jgi:2-C-methyl-D-erythritol 4-phosphate cytidylyltransferase
MRLAVIIPAAGSSRRFIESSKQLSGSGLDRQKIDEDLGGRPLLHRTVELFNKLDEVISGGIIVAGPHDPAAYASFKERHADKLSILGVRLCQGGKDHRYETVANALKKVPEDATHVAVHDAARPATPAEVIQRVIDAALAGHNAVIPAIDVPDTLKRVSAETMVSKEEDPLAAILGASAPKAQARRVEQTIDRSRVVAVQTPQLFEKGLLLRAYAQKDLTSTDDAQLVERLGEPVVVVDGDPTNIKVTRARDLVLVRAILGHRAPAEKPAHLRF